MFYDFLDLLSQAYETNWIILHKQFIGSVDKWLRMNLNGWMGQTWHLR